MPRKSLKPARRRVHANSSKYPADTRGQSTDCHSRCSHCTLRDRRVAACGAVGRAEHGHQRAAAAQRPRASDRNRWSPRRSRARSARRPRQATFARTDYARSARDRQWPGRWANLSVDPSATIRAYGNDCAMICASAAKCSGGQRFAGPYSAPGQNTTSGARVSRLSGWRRAPLVQSASSRGTGMGTVAFSCNHGSFAPGA